MLDRLLQINSRHNASCRIVGSGLFWVDSFVAGGALVEGPEIVQHGGYYYLFFAAGKYCQDSYSEGVARSRSVFGPYEKLGVPLLSTAMVGYAQVSPDSAAASQEEGHEEVDTGASAAKLIGPGHASFVQDMTSKQWFAVYHASRGENCNRYSFIDRLDFGDDGWPRMNFTV
jgi:beta-xylosidase